MYTSELTRLNAWHQDVIAIERAISHHAAHMDALDRQYLRNELAMWGPKKGAPLPIRGRDDEIDRWIEDEYADQADGWCPERFDPELLLAFI